MKKKQPKKSGPMPEDNPKRHQNVLLEQIRDDVKRVAEGHSGLVQDISEIKVTLDEHKTHFDRIEMVVSENRKDIKELKTDVSHLKTDVSQLKTDVSHLKTDVSHLKTDVSQLKTDVTHLKTDVTHLKSGQEEIKQKLDTVTTDHEQRIQRLEAVG